MSERGRHNDWNARGRIERLAKSDKQRAERAKALLVASKFRIDAAKIRPLERPGISARLAIRYATTSDPQHWRDPAAGRVILTAIANAAQDGADRAVFAWPNELGGSFVSAAIALQQVRASGALAYATFGYWPWRNGATWSARSILVNPADLLGVARRICTEVRAGAAWAQDSFAHEDRAVIELRFDELLKDSDPHGHDNGERIVVRSPNLLEVTAVFAPEDAGRSTYKSNADQVLYRVRRYTRIGKLSLGERLSAVADPMRAPFALLGLPAAARPEVLNPLLNYARVAQKGLDVVVVDLSHSARRSMTDDWEKPFAALVSALDAMAGRRPPMVVVAEDAYTFSVATRMLRTHSAALVPRRAAPSEIGAYLTQRGVLGPAAEVPSDLPTVSFEPDIKDAALAPIRTRLLSLGSALREEGGAVAADPASRALRFLRRAASMPIGLAEARRIVDILHPENDEIDRSARSAFRPKMELAELRTVADRFPALGAEAKQLAEELEAKAESWSAETPVSAKLAALLDAADNRAAGTMVAVASDRIRDILVSSERALQWACEVVAPDHLAGRLASVRPEKLVVVGPSPELVRVLLTCHAVPRLVALIGDTAGVGLLSSEIRPITRIEAFRPLAARAEALQAALARCGGQERLDLAEAEFRVKASVPEGEVDFTRAGEDYRGDVIHIVTARGSRFAYRPGSDVLVQSAGELRPFIRRDARFVQSGDLMVALGNGVRERLRHALSGSRRIQDALATYHNYLTQLRPGLPGQTVADKARNVVSRMQSIERSVPDSEVYNVRRWITADATECDADGNRLPGAARDWRRFSIFAQAVGMPDVLAKTYWQAVVMPTRAYRVQEGHGFNQQVVQFILDPEGTAIGAGVFARLPDLWQLVLAAVDEVVSTSITHRVGSGSHG